MRPDTSKILVVATRTAACDDLLHALTRRAALSPARFSLLVPATPYGWAWLADMHSGGVAAQRYLDAAIDRYRDAGVELAASWVGDPDPLAAVMDATHAQPYDEVIVCTLPRHLSRWLRLSLPHRVGAVTGLPVTHVVGTQTRLTSRPDGRRVLHTEPATQAVDS